MTIKNENTDTLEDQAREYYAKNSPFAEVRCIKLMADFARKVAKEAVRRREIEIFDVLQAIATYPDAQQRLIDFIYGDLFIKLQDGEPEIARSE